MSPTSSSPNTCAPPVGKLSPEVKRQTQGRHRHREASSGAQHAGDLGQCRGRIGYQLQHRDRHRGIDGLVAQWESLCVGPQEADLRARRGAHRAGQHRLGDVHAQGQPLGSRGMGQPYGLDEPSAGLHPADAEPLLDVLDRLRRAGNSLFVVEHDMDV